MASLGCFIRDTQIRDDIADVMQTMAAISINNDRRFLLPDAYKFLRDNGVEVDLESVAAIYEDTFDLRDQNFNTTAEVYAIAGKSFSDTLDNLEKMQPESIHQVTGKLSPGKKVAQTIANMFRNANVTDVKTQSLLKQFENLMSQAAKRLINKEALPQKATAAPRSFEQILSDAFDHESKGVRTLSGSLNSAKQMWDEFVKEVEKYKKEIAYTTMSPDLQDQFDQYTKDIVNKGYNLLISQKEMKDVVKGALIEAGYFREVDRNGATEKVLDWKKLTDAAGNMDYLRKNVTDVLDKLGYAPWEISRINDALEKEYVGLRAGIIEKRLNELARRNKVVTAEQKSSAKKLAELYTYGLFEATPNTYEQVLNKTLGVSDVDQATFDKLKVFAQALQTLYSTKLNGNNLAEENLTTAVNTINEQMSHLLRTAQNNQSLLLKTMRTIQSVIDASLRFVLTGLKNMALQNPLSGKEAKITAVLQSTVRKETTPALKAANRKLLQAVFKEMALEGGLHYGDLNTTLINRGRLDELVNKVSTNKMYHAIVGTIIGRTGLDAMDSRFKSSLTQKYLIHNMIRILTDPTNPHRMSHDAALQLISDKLTGRSYEEAEAIATSVITKINKDAGRQILNPSPAFVTRFANDIVKAQLISGGTVTEQQILAANNAAYKAAGRDLGHVPNNFISRGISVVNTYMAKEIDEALQRKEYNKAAMLTLSQTFFRSFMNPFVGGSTNWIKLKFEKSGLGIITGTWKTIFKGKPIDLATKSGMKDLERSLYSEQMANNLVARGIVGGAASVIMYGAIYAALKAAFPGDDDKKRRLRMETWRKDNRWASKYTDEFTDEWTLASLYMAEGKMSKYVDNFMNWNDQYSSIALFRKAITLRDKGDVSEAWGKVGEAVGTKVNAPIPYRMFRDIVELSEGVASLVPGSSVATPKYEFIKPISFWQGFLEHGFLETTHIYKPDPAYTLDALPHVSGGTLKQLERLGIHNIDDLRKYAGRLEELHGINKNGRKTTIFDKSERPSIDDILKKGK